MGRVMVLGVGEKMIKRAGAKNDTKVFACSLRVFESIDFRKYEVFWGERGFKGHLTLVSSFSYRPRVPIRGYTGDECPSTG